MWAVMWAGRVYACGRGVGLLLMLMQLRVPMLLLQGPASDTQLR